MTGAGIEVQQLQRQYRKATSSASLFEETRLSEMSIPTCEDLPMNGSADTLTS
jgi:hypothetical protein